MGLQNTLEVIKDFVIAEFSDFDDDNCKVGGESAVFIWLNTIAPSGVPSLGCVIDYSGFDGGKSSEFKSLTINWGVDVTFIVSILEDEMDESVQIAYGLVDQFMTKVAQNPTATKAVTFMRPTYGRGVVYPYVRGNHAFVLAFISLNVMENIS